MEKNKSKKPKTLQIKYPMPYTQSWPDPERAPKHKKATLRSTQKKLSAPVQKCCRPCMQLRPNAPDPTVPHLKYGIFPKKPSLAREQSKTVTSKPTKRPSIIENLNKEKKKSTRKAQSTEHPLFVFRAIDKSSTRQLWQKLCILTSDHGAIYRHPCKGIYRLQPELDVKYKTL